MAADYPFIENNDYVTGPSLRPCGECDTLTKKISIDFESAICSKGCRDAAWRAYAEAMRR